MGESLKELEVSLQSAGKKFDEADNAYRAAQEKTAAAVQARDEILYKYGLGNPTEDCMKELELADQVIKDAQEEQDKAATALTTAFGEAQAAAELVEEKKECPMTVRYSRARLQRSLLGSGSKCRTDMRAMYSRAPAWR